MVEVGVGGEGEEEDGEGVDMAIKVEIIKVVMEITKAGMGITRVDMEIIKVWILTWYFVFFLIHSCFIVCVVYLGYHMSILGR